MKQKTIAQPAWHKILEECKEKIEKKFKEYGNSWVDYSDNLFWAKRLQGEFSEIEYGLQGFDHYQTAQECIDLINICAMIYTNEMRKHIHYLRMGRHGNY